MLEDIEKQCKKIRVYHQRRRDKLKDNAIASVTQKNMIDEILFTRWFTRKSSFKNCELTVMEAFDLMIKDCYYCGDIALSIDRLDSDKDHSLDNCVGCCINCNKSKGAVDPITFILQAVYRTTFEYPEDDNIWYEMKTKPNALTYKTNAGKQGKPYDLTKEHFEALIIDTCKYCHRSPKPGAFFGIDKTDPNGGYDTQNCVTACTSCNWAKWDQNIDEFVSRDRRITDRYLTGCFDDIKHVCKNTSYRRLNTGKLMSGGQHHLHGKTGGQHHTSKKVYQYDKNGTCIGDFGSVTEAAESVDGNASNISACANGNRKSAYKYVWRYE